MKLKELKDILVATGLPVAYYAFPENKAPRLPFVCYFEKGSNNFVADNKVYQPIKRVAIELYSDKKDEVVEGKIEKALNDAEIPWESSETFIESEHCYEKIYEVEV